MGLIDDLNDGAAEAFYGGDPGDESAHDGDEVSSENEARSARSRENIEAGLAFTQDDILSRPLINQLARLGTLTAYIHGNWDSLQIYLDAGIAPDAATYDITDINMQEALVLSLGLNLVGFFIPEMTEVAESLSRRAAEAADTAELDEETKQRISQINTAAAEEHIARMLGFDSVEAFQEARNDPDSILNLDGETPPGVVTMVPSVEDED